MKQLKCAVLLLAVVMLALPLILNRLVHSQTETPSQTAAGIATTDQANKVSSSDAQAAPTNIDNEGVDPNSTDTFTFSTTDDPVPGPTIGPNPPPNCIAPIKNAPANFDNQTNGFLSPANFTAAEEIFEEISLIEDGLGPVYNAQSCKDCHQNPVTGGISQITELRAGHNATIYEGPDRATTIFVDAPGGSLINDRSIPTNLNDPTNPRKDAKLQERVPPLYTAGVVSGGPITQEEPVRTFRTSLNTLGDGFVEATANGTLLAISNRQAFISGGTIKGQAIKVPVLETAPNSDPTQPFPGSFRIGRFGWKDQHASLVSFSGDAYLNEMGITNFLILTENTSLGRSVAPFDPVPDPAPDGEDNEQDVNVFADFMRSTKAPPLDQDIKAQFSTDWQAGRDLFKSLPPAPYEPYNAPVMGCSICHVPAIVTVKPCTPINGGTFTVPQALGNKIFRPFGDFLLHNIGTGDGIVQNGGQGTRLKVRTAPLWGVRTRDRLMHDGETFTFKDAIIRHQGEATVITNRFLSLSALQKKQLIIFIESL